jgi:hypothetical protein
VNLLIQEAVEESTDTLVNGCISSGTEFVDGCIADFLKKTNREYAVYDYYAAKEAKTTGW